MKTKMSPEVALLDRIFSAEKRPRPVAGINWYRRHNRELAKTLYCATVGATPIRLSPVRTYGRRSGNGRGYHQGYIVTYHQPSEYWGPEGAWWYSYETSQRQVPCGSWCVKTLRECQLDLAAAWNVCQALALFSR